MLMKILLPCLLATAHAGFAPRVPPPKIATTIGLKVATTGSGSEWVKKPLPLGASTTPVAVNPISRAERQKIADRVIDPDFSLAVATAILCPLIAWYHPSYMADGSPSLIGVFGAGFHVVFAALLWVQTVRVRLVFEKDSMEFYNVKGKACDLEGGAKLVKKPDNYVAGTVNRWNYDDIINYGFFPSLEFPVICYMKETQTPKEQWNKWFAAFDSYGRGQPHFFPGICNARQIKEEFEKRGIKRKPVLGLDSIKKRKEQQV